MVIDIRQILLWKAENDLFLAYCGDSVYDEQQASNRISRIKTGIGFR